MYNYLEEYAIIKTDTKSNLVTVKVAVAERHRVQCKSDDSDASRKIKITTPMVREYLQICKNMTIEAVVESFTLNNEHKSSLSGTWVFKILPPEPKQKKIKKKKRG